MEEEKVDKAARRVLYWWDALLDSIAVADNAAAITAKVAVVVMLGGFAMLVYGFAAADHGCALKAGLTAMWMACGGGGLFVAATVAHWLLSPLEDWVDEKFDQAYERLMGHPFGEERPFGE